MWPALILAASRKDKVRGRTVTLVLSMMIRNGFSQSGAPSGRKWAVVFFGSLDRDEVMNLIHIGSPRVKVKIRCLDRLKVYGFKPIRLI